MTPTPASRTRKAGPLCLVLPSVALSGCAVATATGPRTETPAPDRLVTLREYMSGTFSSGAQAARDPAYYDIELHATPMWTWRDDGPWLYVEQSLAQTPDKPYRQRVCKLERTGDGAFRTRVFVFADAAKHAGEWKSGSPLSEMAPEQLEERVGCALTLSWDEGTRSFTGSTAGTGCPSELNGAAYASSQAVLTADRLLTWDRGYDTTGQQVWGATKGGYEFERLGDE